MSKTYYIHGNTIRELEEAQPVRRERRSREEIERANRRKARRNAARRNREKAYSMSMGYVGFLSVCVLLCVSAAGTYKFRVCARNSSTYYHSLGAMTGYKSTYVAPAKVTGIKATQVTANQASFSWNETNGVEGYRIMMYDVAAGSYKQLAVTKTNSFVLQGLSGHNTYKIKVVGYITYSGKMINGIESDVVTFTTPE